MCRADFSELCGVLVLTSIGYDRRPVIAKKKLMLCCVVFTHVVSRVSLKLSYVVCIRTEMARKSRHKWKEL